MVYLFRLFHKASRFFCFRLCPLLRKSNHRISAEEGAKGRWALTPSPNPLWREFPEKVESKTSTFSAPLRVGRGVWGEGRDLRSLALPPLSIQPKLSAGRGKVLEAGLPGSLQLRNSPARVNAFPDGRVPGQ